METKTTAGKQRHWGTTLQRGTLEKECGKFLEDAKLPHLHEANQRARFNEKGQGYAAS